MGRLKVAATHVVGELALGSMAGHGGMHSSRPIRPLIVGGLGWREAACGSIYSIIDQLHPRQAESERGNVRRGNSCRIIHRFRGQVWTGPAGSI